MNTRPQRPQRCALPAAPHPDLYDLHIISHIFTKVKPFFESFLNYFLGLDFFEEQQAHTLYKAGADTVAGIQKIFDQGVVSMREGNLARNYEVQNTGKTATEIMKRARANTVDGRLVAVVDDDILSGIYTGTWDKATTEQAKKPQ